MIDLAAAAQFVATHARLIDRRRFAVLVGDGAPDAVVRALAAHQNADGGIGLLEPDLRTPASQPACALYALDILHEVGAADLSLGVAALDWLASVADEDGGVPFVLATARGWPHAPWYQPHDDPPSSLLMTAATAAAGLRLRLAHPWLERATRFCWDRVEDALAGDPYTVRYVADFLDAVPDRSRAEAQLDALAARIPRDGLLRVEAGTDGEVLRPLDVARSPGHVARRLYPDALIDAELARLAGGQQPDGGWTFGWAAWNPAVAWEWRGAVTVEALHTLGAYGRVDLPAAAAGVAAAI